MNAISNPEALEPPPLYANRKTVYTKDVHGPVRSAKWAIMALCLAIYYTLPWLRWGRGPGVPDQAILLDLWHERFYFFNVVLWPQDIWLLTCALILGALSLFFVTSLFGRIWCGYACPQTVWTDLFMMVERWIQGDRNARMKLDAGPWTWNRTWRVGLTHWLWFWIAFWTGGAWIMYFVDARAVVGEFWTGRASSDVYALCFLFTATTYLLAGWAREQVCTYMCPWPRFQSSMLDEDSIMVTYDAPRGEPRGGGKRDSRGGLGDCVDCLACIHVCPTGIDIREGPQLECINCGLCVDACNHVMERMGAAPWLVGWDTLARQKARAQGARQRFRLIRPRTIVYASALALCTAATAYGAMHLSSTNFSAIHDRAPLFVHLKDGSVRNGYTLKIANKTMLSAGYTLTASANETLLLALPEQSPAFGTAIHVTVPPSEVGTIRLVLQGRPTAPREVIHLRLIQDASGESRAYSTLFLSATPTED